MMRPLGRATVTAGAVLLWLVLPGLAGADTRPSTSQAAAQEGYIGPEACATCHEGYDSSITRTKHAFAKDPRPPCARRGCESCHGPGQAHADNPEKVKPKNFTKMAAKEV